MQPDILRDMILYVVMVHVFLTLITVTLSLERK